MTTRKKADGQKMKMGHRTPQEKMGKGALTATKIGSLVHGVYAKDLLLPWDDLDEYADLHAGLRKEFFPNGASEEECVTDLAQLHWLKRTLWRYRIAKVLSDPFTEEIVETGETSWERIRESLREKRRKDRSRQDEETAKVVRALSHVANHFNQLSSIKGAKELTAKFETSVQFIQSQLSILLERLETLPSAESSFNDHYSADSLEKIVRLEAQVEVRISKVFSRLVLLKEFKRTTAGTPPSA